MGTARNKRPVIRLLEALEAEEIPYILIGMSAAVLQGVLGQTLDVDLWIGLSTRQYMRVINIAIKHGATAAANTVVYLKDGMPVNFVFEVTGLASFKTEHKKAHRISFHGKKIPVLPLERIRKSKSAIRRDKDLLHVKLIEEFLRCQKAGKKGKPATRRPANPEASN